MKTIAVIDFETTGMSPDQGARATEIGIVLLQNGEIVDKYQSLMNTGAWIPPFIESLTGISNTMVRQAPAANLVMREVTKFVGDAMLCAHNAAFDQKFWDAEMARIQLRRAEPFTCSLLLSRRIYPQALSHRLSALIDYTGIEITGRFHRALADAEMTALLLMRMFDRLQQDFGLTEITPELLQRIQRASRRDLQKCIAPFCNPVPAPG